MPAASSCLSRMVPLEASISMVSLPDSGTARLVCARCSLSGSPVPRKITRATHRLTLEFSFMSPCFHLPSYRRTPAWLRQRCQPGRKKAETERSPPEPERSVAVLPADLYEPLGILVALLPYPADQVVPA